MTAITARAQAIQIARDNIRLKPFYLDTETTGIGQDAEIVEICLVDDASQVLYCSLVRPIIPIPPDATRIHGITNGMVHDAPAWPEIWSQVSAIMDNRVVGVYNADFDVRMIKQTVLKYRLSWQPKTQFFCIMKLYAQFRGDWNSTKGNYRWHSLESAGTHANIPLPNSHRACDDTQLARAILHHIADQNI